jgi:uncharacterized protein (DUF58 family)
MDRGISLTLEQLIRLQATARGLRAGVRHKTHSPGPAGYLSAFRGRGMEFDETRLYQPGDDARSIDWRVTARRGEPYTKLYREERERPVYFLVDLHPGMYFGTRRVFKSVLAMQLAAIMAWTAEASGDRVGGIIGAGDSHRELAPKPRRAGVLTLLHGLHELQPRKPGELSPGRLDTLLEKLARIVLPGSLVLIFSDFQEMGGQTETHLTTLRQHNDLRIGFISDSLEASPPPKGVFRLGTPALQLNLDTRSGAVRQHWPALLHRRLAQISDICHEQQLRLTHFVTADDPLPRLREFV